VNNTNIFNIYTESNSIESLAEEFYLFSKASYLNGDWKQVVQHAKATKVEDVVAVLLSDKMVKSITKELVSISGVKVNPDVVKDIIENQIVKSEVNTINNKLLKKINTTIKKAPKVKEEILASNSSEPVTSEVICDDDSKKEDLNKAAA
jgi:hypothetical protein